MKRRRGIDILGQRRETPRWVDDPVQRRDKRCFHTGQEAESPSEESLTVVGSDRGYGNNSFVTVSNRS